MPYYVTSVSKSIDIYSILPSDLINKLKEKFETFQYAVGTEITDSEKEFTEDEIIRYLSGLSDQEFLIRYIYSLKGDDFDINRISKKIINESLEMLEELRQIITGKNGLFSKDFDLEGYVDQFIYSIGGMRVTDLVDYDASKMPDNADYYFSKVDVIVELKTIQTDHLKKKIDKIEDQKNKILQIARIVPFKNLDRKLAQVEFNIMRNSLVTATKTANKQIKLTRHILKKPNAKGVVFYINDGFYSINPFEMIELLWNPITRDFSGIDGIFWANFRRLANMKDDPDHKYFIFDQRTRDQVPQYFRDFVNFFGAAWLNYPYALVGNRPDRHIISDDPNNLRKASFQNI